MQAIKTFVKSTLVGGLLFLIPLMLLMMLLGKAMGLASKLAQALANGLQLGDSVSVTLLTVLAVAIIVFVCFVAGLIALTRPGARLAKWFEHSMLGAMPQYQLMKSMTDGLAEVQQSGGMKPALVSIEDGWQLCYWLEDMGNGWVAVFLPQSPTPMSGNIMYFPAERIRLLDIPMYDVIKLLQRIGKGSSEKLRNVDLTL